MCVSWSHVLARNIILLNPILGPMPTPILCLLIVFILSCCYGCCWPLLPGKAALLPKSVVPFTFTLQIPKFYPGQIPLLIAQKYETIFPYNFQPDVPWFRAEMVPGFEQRRSHLPRHFILSWLENELTVIMTAMKKSLGGMRNEVLKACQHCQHSPKLP